VVGALSAARGAHPALAELVTGRAWATWAHDDHRRCRLRSTAGGPRLAGEVGVVADADRCGWLLVPAGSERGAVVVLVSTTAPGVGLRPLDGLDVSRSWCAVTFDDVVVGPEAVVGGAGPAAEALEAEWLLVGATLTAAESVGAMRADLDAAVQYAKDRIAFGRPIGSFQAVKHLLADASLWTEMAMGLVVAAARALGERSPDGAQLAHAAKAFVADHGVALAHDCFQVFGGIGYTWEHDQHLYLRRLAADAGCFGSAGWHRGRMLEGLGV
jgi:alkylation response protein AidB-like acyl-CoA dehydrogenase